LTGVGNKRINAAIVKGDGIPHPHVGIHVLGVKKDKRVAGGKKEFNYLVPYWGSAYFSKTFI